MFLGKFQDPQEDYKVHSWNLVLGPQNNNFLTELIYYQQISPGGYRELDTKKYPITVEHYPYLDFDISQN